MSDWQHGYVTDTPYTFGYYRECALNWIDWVAILSGSEPPVGARRVLELGCGQGYGLCVMAAANPEYHFVGVDFNPEHIAHAKSLSRRTGLKNIDFFENDFISLTERPELPWEACDYMITHGILSWVNAEVRRAVFQIADKCLVPGGLAYFSYNALPGWLSSHPVQHLMRQFADRTGVNAGSFKNALNTLKSLKDVNASVFSAQPGLAKKLEQLEKNPENKTNYLYHEYFNNAWSLFYCTQIADEARAWKLQYLGSATLPDNYDTMLPENMRKVLDAAPDHSMRELYKDMMINQSFRRDVFVRGKAPVWTGERLNLFARRMVTLLKEPGAVTLKFNTDFGEVSGHADVYEPLIRELAKGPVKIADLSKALPGMNGGALLQAVSLLAHGDALGFYVPGAKTEPAVQFNEILAESVSLGAPYTAIALPGIGSGINLDEVQWMALDACNKGADSLEDMAAGVAARLKGLGKSLLKDGQAVPHGQVLIEELITRLDSFTVNLLPVLRRLGGVR